MRQASDAVIVAARRTAVCPRGGALSRLQADELAAPVLAALLEDAGIEPERVDHVLLGNALYGGGNPARLAALRAGLPQSVPAVTIDTQCCSGLDAILLGARLIEAGAADCVIAGGAESFSRAPIRMTRPRAAGEQPVPYDRPSFAPPPFTDPDLADAAARLAQERGITRTDQAAFAVGSHQKALAARPLLKDRLVRDGGTLPDRDGFTRKLSVETALRAPVLAGSVETGLNAATIACEADGAAFVLMMASTVLDGSPRQGMTVRAGLSMGGDPADPALVPVAAAKRLLASCGVPMADLEAVELMEAYAVQAMVTAKDLALDPSRLNGLGGALARGHPIGASGAVLAVHLFEQLTGEETPAEGRCARGMALIAAAGGLGTAVMFEHRSRQDG
ncbi:thiolase family protein [Roseibium sp. Sym1]|uniref:thiolase family protein n=1 Tax=Roseibium sp. Sym1 TaxID=3016006 RepID=UPI0022B5B977|nr:thiolase family protein [Roseibium sp. Sym1]